MQNKHSIIKTFLTLLLCCILGACATQKDQAQLDLTPMPEPVQDPYDQQAFQFIQAYIAEQKGPPNSRYDYTRADLNGDGLRDAIFLFKGPYTYWCGWSGCMMVVLKAEPNGFSLVSEMTGIRGPLKIADTMNYGWKDIIVRVSGTNMPDRTVAMRFDGQSYPSNPLAQTDLGFQLADITGMRIFP